MKRDPAATAEDLARKVGEATPVTAFPHLISTRSAKTTFFSVDRSTGGTAHTTPLE